MNVVVNGERHEVPTGTSVEGLLQHLALDATRLVVQLNEDIIVKEDYPQIGLNENDQVELIQFVGGG